MLSWIGILVGGVFAWFAIKRGFYEMWAFVFNVVISIYLAVFLRPMIINIIPSAGDTAYHNVLTVLITSTVAFLILHAISYIFIISQFSISFPKVFEFLGSGFLGFLAGFLIWHFVSLLICIAPISQNSLVERMGFNSQLQQANISCVSWWCNLVNRVVSSQDSDYTTEKVISKLINDVKKTPARSKQAQPVEPKAETGIIEEELGPPPDAELEDI